MRTDTPAAFAWLTAARTLPTLVLPYPYGFLFDVTADLAIAFRGNAFAFISTPGRSLLVAEVFFVLAFGFNPLGLPTVLPMPFAAFIVCVARLLPDAVLSLPPLAVAPVVAKRPRLSLTYFLPDLPLPAMAEALWA